MTITLWGAGTTRTLRPIWMAEELGLAYELKPIGPRTGETQTEAYTALNRKQKVPFMVDGAVKLSESVAIARYLRDAYPADALYRPDTLADRAKEDEWCNYIYGELDETGLYVIRRHGDLTDIYGAAPEVVKATEIYIARHLAVIERHIDGRPALLDGGFGLADIILVSCIDWAVFYGIDVPQAILDYREHIGQRPAFQAAMAINYGALTGAEHGTT